LPPAARRRTSGAPQRVALPLNKSGHRAEAVFISLGWVYAHEHFCRKTFPREAPFATLRYFPCSLWPESCEEHLPTSIAGVLRLRAITLPLCDRSARRFAQDDGFVEGLKNILLATYVCKKYEKIEKVTGSPRDDKGENGWIVERGRLGPAFPPFAKSAKDGAPDHL
jgi:hypothetical protein